MLPKNAADEIRENYIGEFPELVTERPVVIGSVVTAKSGGPRMTVVSILTKPLGAVLLDLMWFDGNVLQQTDSVPLETVVVE